MKKITFFSLLTLFSIYLSFDLGASNLSGGGGSGGSGTVTSVDATVPSLLSVSGNPVTTAGTLAFTYSGTALPILNGGTGATTPTAALAGILPYQAPSDAGKALATNGTSATWTSVGSGSSAGVVFTGAGHANSLTKFTAPTVLGESKWIEGATNGEFQFNNFTAAKGSKTAPLVSLNGSSTSAAGLFTNSSNELNLSSGGGHILNLDSAATNILDAANPTVNYVRVLNSSGNLGFVMNGAGTQYTFTPVSGAANARINIQGASGESNMTLIAYPSSNATTPYLGVLQNQNDAFIVTNVVGSANGAASVGIGTPLTKNNALTVTGYADITNVRGTTTANATTSITGTNTKFTNDFGIGDWVSTSNAATTYARVLTLGSSTAMTVSANLGDGTTTSFNKRQALQSWRLSTGAVVAEVDPNGKFGLSSASNKTAGTGTCNGSTEVTVNNTQITTTTHISISYLVPAGGATVAPFVSARVAGTSFGFKCTAADTTSTISYTLTELLP